MTETPPVSLTPAHDGEEQPAENEDTGRHDRLKTYPTLPGDDQSAPDEEDLP